jgi:hypothetical protein
MRRFGTALLIASSASLAFGLAAVPADAGSTQTFQLLGNATQVKTSTGKSVDLEVSVFKAAGENNTSINITLLSGSFSRGERHTWTFMADGSAFDYNNGTGTLDTGNLPMKFGRLTLTFHKDSQHTTDCPDTGSVTDVRGSLKGSVDFDSKSDSWGTVHDNTFTFDTPNIVSVRDNCTGEGNTKVVCSKVLSWTSPFQPGNAGSGNGFTFTQGGDTTTTITGSRLVYLDNQGQVYRSDIVSDVGRTPLVDGSKLVVRTKKGTRVSGKAVITGGNSSQNSQKCHKGGKTLHEHYTYRSGADWASQHGIKFHQSAFNDFATVGDANGAYWTKQTYS